MSPAVWVGAAGLAVVVLGQLVGGVWLFARLTTIQENQAAELKLLRQNLECQEQRLSRLEGKLEE